MDFRRSNYGQVEGLQRDPREAAKSAVSLLHRNILLRSKQRTKSNACDSSKRVPILMILFVTDRVHFAGFAFGSLALFGAIARSTAFGQSRYARPQCHRALSRQRVLQPSVGHHSAFDHGIHRRKSHHSDSYDNEQKQLEPKIVHFAWKTFVPENLQNSGIGKSAFKAKCFLLIWHRLMENCILQDDRKKIITELCDGAQVKCEKLNFEKFANLTEGYTVGYLQQFVERAIFYAHRNSKISRHNQNASDRVIITTFFPQATTIP